MTKRILVVEDQDDLRGVLRDLLTRSGYEVAEAATDVAELCSSARDLLRFELEFSLHPTRDQLS